jgi:hypothetical protein
MSCEDEADDDAKKRARDKRYRDECRQRKRDGRSYLPVVIDDLVLACRAYGLHIQFNLADASQHGPALDQLLRKISRDEIAHIDDVEHARRVLTDAIGISKRLRGAR